MANFVYTYSAPGGTVSITATQPTAMVAPAQVWLEATDHDGLASFEDSGSVYDGAAHEYYHEWTINGSPLSDWAKPANLLAEHNNPNKAFGKKVAFVLPTAADRIYVDNTGVYTDVPAASGKVSDLDELLTEMATRTTNPTWVRFKRGQEFSLDDALITPSNDNFRHKLVIYETNKVAMLSPSDIYSHTPADYDRIFQ